jgi:hypothetical protein
MEPSLLHSLYGSHIGQFFLATHQSVKFPDHSTSSFTGLDVSVDAHRLSEVFDTVLKIVGVHLVRPNADTANLDISMNVEEGVQAVDLNPFPLLPV